MHNQVPSDPFQQPATPYAAPAPHVPPYDPFAPQPYPGDDLPHEQYGPPSGYGPPPGYVPPEFAPYPAQAGTNGFAIVSLVASICGGLVVGTLLGMGFGIAALVQIKRRPQKGRGMAIAGVVISSLTLVVTIAIVTTLIVDESRDRAAGITDVEATALKRGDCIREFDESTTVYDMPVVPCTQPHAAEVYHVFTLPSGPFPGEPAIEEESDDECGVAFEPYDTPQNEELDIYYLHPQRSTWSRDRGVTCIVVDPKGTRTTSILN
ncbi:DUF4190 domain-containing protein [Actinoplanes utahensis]|uniref:DUF4190 domain-containing protein n=1 Tax=Actinoplanes utahensis TaxID=1869 RepID=UPI001376F66B|nr:DUF4190 domain-containing protein [Actinoplanes utahensis]